MEYKITLKKAQTPHGDLIYVTVKNQDGQIVLGGSSDPADVQVRITSLLPGLLASVLKN